MAGRHALLPLAGLRSVGGSQRSDGRQDRAVIFCIIEGEMVLLQGFVKKTQKTPPQEIDLALRRKRELE